MCNHVLYSVIFRDFFVALSITRSYLGLTATSQSIFWNLNLPGQWLFLGSLTKTDVWPINRTGSLLTKATWLSILSILQSK